MYKYDKTKFRVIIDAVFSPIKWSMIHRPLMITMLQTKMVAQTLTLSDSATLALSKVKAMSNNQILHSLLFK